MKVNITSLDKAGVYRFFESLGLPRYRADQLLLRIYGKYASDIDEIAEFSKELRALLKEIACIGSLALLKKETSTDGAEKFLFSLEDGKSVESVLIPEKSRLTLCISSQVGCAMGCSFCLTGRSGFARNLKSHEIIGQIVAANRIIGPERVTNVVLMGMGEPLANFNAVVDSLRGMVELLGISRRKITLSTSGIVPKLRLLPHNAPGVNLAISLNATTDEVRNRLMPINRRYPIQRLIGACREYPLPPGRRMTFEYVMIGGVNDYPDDARRLVKLLSGILCKVNLIPLNPFPGCGLKRSPDESIQSFQSILMRNKLRAFIRESRGQDINAACGQLNRLFTSDSSELH